MGKITGPIDLIRNSINIFFKKENLIYFAKIYAVLVPFAIFFYYVNNFIQTYTANLTYADAAQVLLKSSGLFIATMIVGLANLVISFWISASGIKAAMNVVSGSNLDFKNTLKFAWKKLWIFSLLSILLTLIIGIGGILLIIPGVYIFVTCYFASFILMEENTGVFASIGKSRQLVKGRFWKVFGRVVVFGIFGILVDIIFSLIPLNLGTIIQPLFGGLLVLPPVLLYKELSSR